jgi:hypothetical protein
VISEEDGKVCVLPKTARMGERSMLAYLEWAIARGSLVAGDVLLMDNEGSFKTEWVRDLMESNGITPLYFPPWLGSIMNPCDNSFHSAFKLALQKLLVSRTSVSAEEKIKLAHQAYLSINDSDIVNMFHHVGILGKNPRRALEVLFKEGCKLPAKWK